VAAGALAVPAARRVAFGSVRHDWLAGELDLDRIDPDGFTVRCKSGTVLRAYRLAGDSYDTKPEGEQFALCERRAAFLHEVASNGVVVRLFGVKRRSAPIEPAAWPSPALQEIGDAEAALYRNAFRLHWFMTLQASGMERLEKADEKVRSLLSAYRPTRLHMASEPGESCPLTGFLNFLTCGDLRDDLRPVSANISANLPASDLTFDRDGSFAAYLPTPTHYRAIGIREWPDQVSGYLLHELMALPGEIEVYQVAAAVPKEAERLEAAQKAAKVAFGVWQNLPGEATAENCPYLKAKGVLGHGVKVDAEGHLVVPARDAGGHLWGVQVFHDDGKRFIKDAHKVGTMHVISPGGAKLADLGGDWRPIVICEGYATGATIYEATKYPTVVAFDAGNLKPVAEAVRAAYPDRDLVIAADNDHANINGNVGVRKAEEAAQAVKAVVAVPPLDAQEKAQGLTDFNDLGQSRNKLWVRSAIDEALMQTRRQAADLGRGVA
jgi:hypothetical protein